MDKPAAPPFRQARNLWVMSPRGAALPADEALAERVAGALDGVVRAFQHVALQQSAQLRLITGIGERIDTQVDHAVPTHHNQGIDALSQGLVHGRCERGITVLAQQPDAGPRLLENRCGFVAGMHSAAEGRPRVDGDGDHHALNYASRREPSAPLRSFFP